MLKLKNLVFVFSGIAVTVLFLDAYAKEQAQVEPNGSISSQSGRVLGVSEERGLPEAQPARLPAEEESIVPELDKSNFAPLFKEGAAKPEFEAESVAVIDAASNSQLYGQKEDKVRAIASISKLMTALVLVDQDPDWDSYYLIQNDDRVDGGRIYVKPGEEVAIRDLLYASLVASDNTASRALVSASGLSYEEFIKRMNEKAKALGLINTSFADPVGISSRNLSTAAEVAVMVKEAVGNGVIRDCLLKDRYSFKTKSGTSKTVNSTDVLLDDFQGGGIRLLGGKTGYTIAAGYCLTAMFEDLSGNKVVTAVLGSPSLSSRFSDTKKLANWAYKSHEWRR
jgi:D-alanyl-D-alanine endopeptidase (penicillin-binding protein 7)